MIMPENSLLLEVLEADIRDFGRSITRIDPNQAKSINLADGDIIEIKGKRTTVAKYLSVLPENKTTDFVMLDGMSRHNADTSLGKKVSIRKADSVKADEIIVAPLENIPPLDGRYIADALENIPLIKRDRFLVPYFGGQLKFQVMKIIPEGQVAVVTQKTTVYIASDTLVLSDSQITSIKEKIMGKIATLENLDGDEVEKLLSYIKKSYNYIRDGLKTS